MNCYNQIILKNPLSGRIFQYDTAAALALPPLLALRMGSYRYLP